jgi:hypothetical protein
MNSSARNICYNKSFRDKIISIDLPELLINHKVGWAEGLEMGCSEMQNIFVFDYE